MTLALIFFAALLLVGAPIARVDGSTLLGANNTGGSPTEARLP